MKPPTRKLIGGVRESHTREYLFLVSAQMSGCRRRSSFRAQEQQERKNQSKTTKNWEEGERVRGERPPGGACGPQEGGWRGQELGRATWPPRPGVDPLVSLRYLLVAFYLEILFYFFWNFPDNFTVENFSKFQKLQKLSWTWDKS